MTVLRWHSWIISDAEATNWNWQQDKEREWIYRTIHLSETRGVEWIWWTEQDLLLLLLRRFCPPTALGLVSPILDRRETPAGLRLFSPSYPFIHNPIHIHVGDGLRGLYTALRTYFPYKVISWSTFLSPNRFPYTSLTASRSIVQLSCTTQRPDQGSALIQWGGVYTASLLVSWGISFPGLSPVHTIAFLCAFQIAWSHAIGGSTSAGVTIQQWLSEVWSYASIDPPLHFSLTGYNVMDLSRDGISFHSSPYFR